LPPFPASRVCVGGLDSSNGDRTFPPSARRGRAVRMGGLSKWICLSCANLGQTLAASGQGVCRFHRRPAKSARTRLVRLFKKGDRPLCPLKMRFGRLRNCGLGTEWSVPFFEARMSFMLVGKPGRPELIPFANREPRQSAVSPFSGFAGLRGGPDSFSAGRTFPPSA
jgi:hypothetical protein